MMLYPLIRGFGVGFGLIVAIGPQNTFLISQGIKREHILLSAAVCIMIDALLISLGVLGLGALFNDHPNLIVAARWFGAIFLMTYAIKAFYSAIKPHTLKNDELNQEKKNTKSIIVTLLCLGLLNPHAYLDTVVLIGSIAAQGPANTNYLFALGAIFASVIWFFSITFGAKILTPVFKKENAWRVLDLIIGLTMFSIALTLIQL